MKCLKTICEYCLLCAALLSAFFLGAESYRMAGLCLFDTIIFAGVLVAIRHQEVRHGA